MIQPNDPNADRAKHGPEIVIVNDDNGGPNNDRAEGSSSGPTFAPDQSAPSAANAPDRFPETLTFIADGEVLFSSVTFYDDDSEDGNDPRYSPDEPGPWAAYPSARIIESATYVLEGELLQTCEFIYDEDENLIDRGEECHYR